MSDGQHHCQKDTAGKKERTGIGHSCFTDNVYAQVEHLYTSCSNHAELICSFVESAVLPNLSGDRHESRLSFLDVGPGPGKITRRLAKHFSRVEVIEPNRSPEYLAEYAKEPAFVVNSDATVEDSNIPSQAYDLVLCSHVLYHIPMDTWEDCLTKLCHALRPPAGRLVVALTAPRGSWHKMQLSLRPGKGSGLHTGTVCSMVKNIGMIYKAYPIKSKVVVSADLLPEFRNLVRLFLIADTWSAEEWDNLGEAAQAEAEGKIERYIQDSCFVKEKHQYMLEIDEDYVVVDAPRG